MQRGFSLLEVLLVLLLTALIGAQIGGLRRFREAIELDAAKRAAVSLAQEASRLAYRHHSSVEFRGQVGQPWLTLQEGSATVRTLALPDGVQLTKTPAGGQVRFDRSGTAANATFEFTRGSLRRTLIINQRGIIR